MRGGHWGIDAQYVRVHIRYANVPTLCNYDLGFRLASGSK
jgi:formylglycine-generating enzyme required for sulfatase activity